MIRLIVNGREARCETSEPLTSGSVGMTVSFALSSEWENLSAIAVFRGSGTEADVALLEECCTVPAEVLAEAGGLLWIGVYGQNGAGTTVIPTVWARAGQIRQGTAPSGVDPAEASPSWSAQVQAAAALALQKAGALETAAASIPAAGSVDEAGLLSFANAGGEALFNVQLPLYEGEVSGWTS